MSLGDPAADHQGGFVCGENLLNATMALRRFLRFASAASAFAHGTSQDGSGLVV